MFTLALCVVSLELAPDPRIDAERFGTFLHPANEFGFYWPHQSQHPVRLTWLYTTKQRGLLEEKRHHIAWIGNESELNQLICQAKFVEVAWCRLDDMTLAYIGDESRVRAAHRLREHIGPVAYYLGYMPELDFYVE